ncbi:MAG: hypothetical protein Salg2KO_22890 [Salibacteraceae bacterium]
MIDEAGEGIVKSISGDQASVEVDGLELPFAVTSLVKVQHDHLVKPTIKAEQVTAEEKLKAIAARNRLRKIRPIQQTTYELDLHMHELLDRFDHMSKGEMLQYQMRCAKQFVQEAREKHFKKIVLIHGVGEGILKTEIRHWLDGQDKITYHDAPYRTYGYGATEVILWR